MTGARRLLGARLRLPCTLSGSLTTSSGSSPVTSATRTVTVPAGNTGDLRFNNIVNDGSAFEYSKNAGAFTTISEDLVVNFADTNTLAVRATLPIALDECTFDLVDQTMAANVGSYTLTRT